MSPTRRRTRRQLLAAIVVAPIAGRAAIAAVARPGMLIGCDYARGGVVSVGVVTFGGEGPGPEAWIPLRGIRLIEISVVPIPPNPDCRIRL